MSIPDIDGFPFFAKGINFDRRAQIVFAKALNKIVFSIDCSSFDNSVRGAFIDAELTVMEHFSDGNFDRSIYKECYMYLD